MAEGEIVTAEGISQDTALEQLSRAEIDVQIATAHKFPRSVTLFQRDVKSLVTLSAEIAAECTYVLPRGGKQITGPSARFAEIIASCWGNSRAGARVIAEDDRFVTAQGIFHDLQRNVAITYEVRRRITDRNGRKFNDDMVGVTSNAACSIALRNAVMKGVPKAFWIGPYLDSVAAAKGDAKTIGQRREALLEAFRQSGFEDSEIFALAEAKGKGDIDIDRVVKLSGILTALNDGDTTKADLLKEIGQGNSEKKTPTPPKIDGNSNAEKKSPPKPKGDAKANDRAKGEANSKAADDRSPPPVEGDPRDSAPSDAEETELRTPQEILGELENVLSGISSEEDLAQVKEEYLAMKELDFPADKSKALEMIEKAREEILNG